MIKNYISTLLLLAATGLALPVTSAEVTSLRGVTDLNADSSAPEQKIYNKDGEPISRDYVQQPPLIPHKIENYQINLKSNKCLSCHSWKHYREAGATKISQTHFEDRESNVLANVSARRYFCTQCHVPQVNAQPLVDNTFQPITAISDE